MLHSAVFWYSKLKAKILAHPVNEEKYSLKTQIAGKLPSSTHTALTEAENYVYRMLEY